MKKATILDDEAVVEMLDRMVDWMSYVNDQWGQALHIDTVRVLIQ